MLSIHNVSSAAQAAAYFERDDYYVGSQQRAPSAWWGVGAERLGLAGEVDRAVFERLLEGQLPDGTTLPKRQGKEHRPGLDLTFSAPKSVSLLALVRRDDDVVAAHHRAVSTALSFLETEAAQARITVDGVTTMVATGNLVVAQFTHDTSRTMDPQLHTHSVVLNATLRPDGAWRAVSNEAFYDLKMVAGAVYRAELARGLEQLGYRVERTHNDGRFEVAGFTAEQLEGFSKRRAAIEEALAQRGLDGAVDSARMALLTRAAKREADREDLLALWQVEAEFLGIRFPDRTQDRSRPQLSGPSDRQASWLAAVASVDFAVAHLSERRTTFAERDLLAAALGHGVGKVTLREIAEELEARIEHGRLQPAEPHRRGFGDRGRYFTTPEALSVELSLVAAVERGRADVVPIVARRGLRTRLKGEGLTDGQAQAAALTLETRDRFVGIQGSAGTGKTTMLKRVREFAEAQGYEVLGLAPSATAAHLLRTEAGISSQTVARHLEGGVPSGAPGAKRPQLWIVDEVSMLGNRQALELFRAAEEAQARVVLVGDRDQLPSIEAGQVFALLADHGLKTAEMKEILRQKDPILKAAVEAAIAQRPEAFDLLADRIHEVADREDRLREVAQRYLGLSAKARNSTLVLTATHADRRALHGLIREGLRESGGLGAEEIGGEIWVNRSLTRAELKESRSYGVGDRVQFQARVARLGVEPGDAYRVEAVDPARNMIRLGRVGGGEGARQVEWEPHRFGRVAVYRAENRRLAVGDLIRWTANDRERGRRNGETAQVIAVDPSTRIAKVRTKAGVEVLELEREPHWDHGYVSTIHGAQGRTVDRVILHADSGGAPLSYAAWYVAVSRARHAIEVIVDARDRLRERLVGEGRTRARVRSTSEARGLELGR